MNKEKTQETVKKDIEINKEHFAIARAINLPISTKHSVEIANFIRNKELKKTIKSLEEVLAHKKAIPFKRYNTDLGHKSGKIAAGSYPEKAISYFIELLHTAEANAENKGLDASNLIIVEIRTNKGAQEWHYGRKKRRKTKNTHLYLKVMEKEK